MVKLLKFILDQRLHELLN